MPILHKIIEVPTQEGINIYNITPQVSAFLAETAIRNGQVLVFSRHTTTGDRYLHNDLHLRPNIPDDEPMNAHSHLMAITLSTSEVIPVVEGQLALGTYQSILFFELDGPRQRTIFCQVSGE